MKKLFFAFVLLITIACGDGDLAVESIDFDPNNIQSCPDNTSLFFNINGAEAIILNIPDNFIENAVTTEGDDTSTIPGQTQFFYRFFSDNATQALFCDELPPSTPIVNEELQATGGVLTASTNQFVENNRTILVNTLNIQNLVLLNSNGERLIDSNFEFGDVTLSSTDILFDSANLQICPTDPSILFNVNGNQAIMIDLPDGVILNQSNQPDGLTADIANGATLSYFVFDADIPANFLCTQPLASTPAIVTQINATAGTINVNTVESTETAGTFIHNISVSGLSLLNGRDMPLLGTTVDLGSVNTTN
ncbi:hypothetical protein GTQ40_17640 [Flavobacteriaceae bacterium R38]|nr:hypothetical protein [Flavobacteriaceae bacterium R38]